MRASHATILATALTLGGCAMDPTHLEDDFGSSVRQMVAAQIHDPETASDPDPNAPDLVDGVATSRAVQGYREDAKREERRFDLDRGVILDPRTD